MTQQARGKARVLQVGLYSPLVPAGAIPPAQYPPRFTLRKEALALGVHAVGLATGLVVGHGIELSLQALPGLATLHTAARLGDLVTLIFMSSAVFAGVANVFLGRSGTMMSRYGSRLEWIKWVALLTLVLWPSLLSFSFRRTSAPVYALGLFAGSHFVFLDNVTILQTFGSKLGQGLPGWKLMSRRERLLGVGLLAGILAVIYMLAGHFSRDASAFWRTAGTYGVLSLGLAGGYLMWARECCFHAHHYFNFGLLLPLTPFSDHGAILLQSFVLGSMIEGIACWGMDPIFHDPLAADTCFATQFWTTFLITMDSPSSSSCSTLIRVLAFLLRHAAQLSEKRFSALGLGILRPHLARMSEDFIKAEDILLARSASARGLEMNFPLEAARHYDDDDANANANLNDHDDDDDDVWAWTRDVASQMASSDADLVAFLDVVPRGLLAGSEELHRAAQGRRGEPLGAALRAALATRGPGKDAEVQRRSGVGARPRAGSDRRALSAGSQPSRDGALAAAPGTPDRAPATSRRAAAKAQTRRAGDPEKGARSASWNSYESFDAARSRPPSTPDPQDLRQAAADLQEVLQLYERLLDVGGTTATHERNGLGPPDQTQRQHDDEDLLKLVLPTRELAALQLHQRDLVAILRQRIHRARSHARGLDGFDEGDDFDDEDRDLSQLPLRISGEALVQDLVIDGLERFMRERDPRDPAHRRDLLRLRYQLSQVRKDRDKIVAVMIQREHVDLSLYGQARAVLLSSVRELLDPPDANPEIDEFSRVEGTQGTRARDARLKSSSSAMRKWRIDVEGEDERDAASQASEPDLEANGSSLPMDRLAQVRARLKQARERKFRQQQQQQQQQQHQRQHIDSNYAQRRQGLQRPDSQELERLQRANAELRAELQTMQRSQQEKERQIDALERDMKEQSVMNSRVIKEMETMYEAKIEHAIIEHEAALEDVQRARALLESERDQHSRALADVRARLLKQAREEAQDHFKQWKEISEGAWRQQGSILSTQAAAKARDEVQEQLIAAARENEKLAARNEILASEVRGLQARCEQFEAQSSIEKTQASQSADFEKTIHDLKLSLEQAQFQRDTLQEEAFTYAEDLAKAQAANDEFAAEMSRVQEAARSLQQDRDSLQADLITSQEHASQVCESRDAGAAQIAQLQSNLERAQAELRDAAIAAESREAQLRHELESVRSELMHARESWSATYAENDAETSHLRSQLAAEAKRSQSAQEHVADLEAQIEGLRMQTTNELEDARVHHVNDVQALRTEIERLQAAIADKDDNLHSAEDAQAQAEKLLQQLRAEMHHKQDAQSTEMRGLQQALENERILSATLHARLADHDAVASMAAEERAQSEREVRDSPSECGRAAEDNTLNSSSGVQEVTLQLEKERDQAYEELILLRNEVDQAKRDLTQEQNERARLERELAELQVDHQRLSQYNHGTGMGNDIAQESAGVEDVNQQGQADQPRSEDDLERLSHEVEHIRASAAQAQAERAHLEEQVAYLQGALDQAHAKMNESQEPNGAVQGQAEELQAELKQARKAASDAGTERLRVERHAAQLQELLAQEQSHNRREAASFAAEKFALERQVADLHVALHRLQQSPSTRDRDDDTQEGGGGLGHQLAQLNSTLARAQKDSLAAVNTQVSQLRDALAESKSARDKLEQEQSRLTCELQEALQQNACLKESKASLAQDLEDSRLALEEVQLQSEREQAEIKEALERLRAALQESQRNSAQAQLQSDKLLGDLRTTLAAVQSQYAESKASNNELEEELQRLRVTLTNAQSDHAEVQAHSEQLISELRDSLRDTESEHVQEKDRNAHLEGELSQLRLAQKNMQDENARVQSQNEELVNDLRAALGEAHNVQAQAETNCVELEEQITQLRQALEDAQHESDQATAQSQELITGLRASLEGAQAEHTQGYTRNIELEQEVAHLRQTLEDAQRENALATAQNEELIAGLRASLEGAQAEHSQGHTRNIELEQEVAQLRQTLEEAQRESAKATTQSEELIAGLRASLQDAQAEHTQGHTRNSELEQEVAHLRQTLEDAQRENAQATSQSEELIAGLRASLQGAQAEHAQGNTRTSELEQEVKQLRQTLEDAQHESDQATAQSQELIADLRASLQGAQAEHAQGNTRTSELEQEVAHLRQTLEDAQRENAQATSQSEELIAGLRASLQGAQAEHAQGNTRTSELEQELTQLRMKLDQVLKENNDVMSQLAKTEEEASNLRNLLDEAKFTISKSQQDRVTLDGEVSRLCCALDDAQQQITQANHQKKLLEQRVEELGEAASMTQVQDAEVALRNSAKMEELREQLEQARAALDGARQNAADAHAEQERLERDLAQVRVESEANEDAAVHARNEKESLEHQVARVRESLEQVQETNAQERSSLMAENSKLEEQISQLRNALAQTQEAVTSGQATLVAENAQLESELEDLRTRISQEHRSSMNGKVEAERDDLMRQVVELQNALAQAKQEGISQHSTSQPDEQAPDSQVKLPESNFNGQLVSELQTALEQAKRDLQAANNSVKEGETASALLEEEKQGLEARLANAVSEASTLAGQLESVMTNVRISEAGAQELQAKIDKLEGDLAIAKRERDEELRASEEEARSLRDQIGNLFAERDAMQDSYAGRVASLEEELAKRGKLATKEPSSGPEKPGSGLQSAEEEESPESLRAQIEELFSERDALQDEFAAELQALQGRLDAQQEEHEAMLKEAVARERQAVNDASTLTINAFRDMAEESKEDLDEAKTAIASLKSELESAQQRLSLLDESTRDGLEHAMRVAKAELDPPVMTREKAERMLRMLKTMATMLHDAGRQSKAQRKLIASVEHGIRTHARQQRQQPQQQGNGSASGKFSLEMEVAALRREKQVLVQAFKRLESGQKPGAEHKLSASAARLFQLRAPELGRLHAASKRPFTSGVVEKASASVAYDTKAAHTTPPKTAATAGEFQGYTMGAAVDKTLTGETQDEGFAPSTLDAAFAPHASAGDDLQDISLDDLVGADENDAAVTGAGVSDSDFDKTMASSDEGTDRGDQAPSSPTMDDAMEWV
ncbi:Laminin subunit alpha [Hondaea fermentalgiana]|uniref:Laminin subunit alpha n=1 Tax=Hondaea fermentalgiana TaxID=2315210 RepID=A0A2R5GCV0_9STRA|nr:Laminin subunit alpha [Hondaea fermentalgiana]|eukprot:GBG28796.1 Laminin subunit alpha [Hondaea fermentalgiana]